ncbi:MAG: transcriptional regulator [Gordonia sp.]|uniref:LCP family protein n=1 Tax=Gordonia sp. (in: high G+C Gram-positive bacteria) TaxID=84139 RepID=UPI000C362974|nr:LCP family protein [Gordonia sp. (in: high G+C Gram-positive bacteria)]MAU82654.1 transcriptional regulator [Gordonia sp. (in: high G+C Gram-positive bacteria)]
MSRRGSGPDEPADEGSTPRRGRRAGRSGAANDFSEMFGQAPTNDAPAHGALHEPRATDRYVRGRTRLTVRELMEQMNAGGEAGPAEPSRVRRQPPADEAPTEVHRFEDLERFPNENDVTTQIPTIRPPATVPDTDVDLSDDATRERVTAESRGQGSRVRPLQPTPDLSDTIPPRSRPRRHPGTRADRRNLGHNVTVTGRILVAVACVMALVGTGFVWGYLQSWNGNWKTINAVNPEDANIRNKDAQYGDENYLIVGTDTRAGQNAKVGAGTTDDAAGARSDTIILVNIPANRSRVVAVSFPRDLQVDRPACQQWDNATGTYGEELPAAYGVKLNGVYADGGPKCLVSVITQMSGLNINRFIAMDFFGFEKVVRAVGGVEVCSPTPLYDYELGQVLRKPGTQKLTGRRALNYVRARNIASEGNGDYGRIKRQQLFMSSLLRATLSGNVLSSPNKLNSIVNTFIEYSFVDGVDTQSLLNLAESMQGIEAGRVTFLTIPTSGTTTDGLNNEIPRTDDINAIFNAIIDDAPLPGEQAKQQAASSSSSSSTSATSRSTTSESAPTQVSATAQNPGNVGVRVLNGSGRTGAAGDTSDQLVSMGFDVRGVADASENREDTVIRYGGGEEDSAATLATMFPGSSIQLDRTVKSGVEVILGSEYDGSIGSPAAVGSTISVSQLPPASNSSNLPNDLAVTNAGDTTCS